MLVSKKIIAVIEEQTDYEVFYPTNDLRKAGKVTVNVKGVTVQDFLNICLANQPFTFTVDDRSIGLVYDPTVVLVGKEVPRDMFRIISGLVVDSANVPVPGATITLSGTNKTIVASKNGSFKIRIPTTVSEIEISSFNYQQKFIRVNTGNDDLGKLMLSKKAVIEENLVYFIGYGVQKKSDLTGSISIVNRKDIGDRTSKDIVQGLVGRAPGLDISGNTIRVRGTTSLNFTDPLIVIDGFLGGSLGNVNPNDIMSMEVLKDASSTAIYGARGANGVILITTKSGKTGDVKCSITAFTGFANTTRRLPVLNSEQYVEYVNDLFSNAGQVQNISERLKSAFAKVTRTNWQDEVFRSGQVGEMDIDFSGGTEKATYFFSAGFRHDEGITIGPSSDDIYIGIRNTFKVKNWFRAGDNLALSYKITRGAAPWDVKSVVNMPPYLEVKDENNFWGYSAVDRTIDLGDVRNPVALSALTHPRQATLGYNANLWAEIEPIKGLVYRIQAGINGSSGQIKIWNDSYVYAGAPVPNNYAEKSFYSFYPVVENYLTYKHRFARHDITVMAGNSWQDGAQSGGIGITGEGYALTEIPNVFNAQNRSITNEDFSKQSFLSYFGRLNYQFDDRYLLTFNVRRDGSPRFAPANRWATFPSLAVGWKLHEIAGVKDLNLFDELKLRLSVGAAGNDGIGDFKYVSPVWTNGVYYPFGVTPALVSGATVVLNSSQSIRWETTVSKTIGFDMGFLKNALQVGTEYFYKNSKDILFNVPRAASLGYGIPPFGGGDALVNAASCINKGFEFQVKYRHRSGNKFAWWVSGNLTLVNNKVTSLGLGQPYLTGVNKTSVGNPIGYFYGYVAEGVFARQQDVDAANEMARQEAKSINPALTSSELLDIRYQDNSTQPGDIRFKDLNGDGKITVADQTMIGNSIPTRQYGIFGNLQYGGFDLDLYFQGTGGYQIFYRGFDDTRGMQGVQNQETFVLNRWRSEAEPGNGKVPRAILGDPSQNNRPSTRMISNGDYFKLRQLSVGYTFSDKLMRKMDIASCRVYLSGSNIFTITPYKEFDPEYSGPNLTRGADWLNFPINPRNFVVGLKLTL